MTIGEWQQRLESTFGNDTVSARLLDSVIGQEARFTEELLSTFHGHVALIHAFHGFFAETLNVALSNYPEEPDPENPSYWGAFLLDFITAFRDFRAAELVFRAGYPLAGYRMLRDLKDRALYTAAVVGGETSWPDLRGTHLWGTTGLGANEEAQKVRKAAEQEQNRVLQKMIRRESGLSPNTLEWLQRWERLFHAEVHGSTLTSATIMTPWKDGVPLTLGPVLEETSASPYMNRVYEIGWLWLKLLPFMQSSSGRFGEEWAAKWHILDESFKFIVEDLRNIGKVEIVDAILELIKARFDLNPDSYYVDRRSRNAA
jgi:hypothetical protein